MTTEPYYHTHMWRRTASPKETATESWICDGCQEAIISYCGTFMELLPHGKWMTREISVSVKVGDRVQFKLNRNGDTYRVLAATGNYIWALNDAHQDWTPLTFQKDAIERVVDPPTWKLGRWYQRRETGTVWKLVHHFREPDMVVLVNPNAALVRTHNADVIHEYKEVTP